MNRDSSGIVSPLILTAAFLINSPPSLHFVLVLEAFNGFLGLSLNDRTRGDTIPEKSRFTIPDFRGIGPLRGSPIPHKESILFK